MPRKKANIAMITDPTKTQYLGFADNVQQLFDITKNMNLVTRIDEILTSLNAMKNSIEIPDDADENEKQSCSRKKTP